MLFRSRVIKSTFFKPPFVSKAPSTVPIARKYLTQLQNRTVSQGIQLVLPEELYGHLGRIGQGRGGARHLRRVVQEQVEGPLAAYLLGCSRKPGKVQAKLEGEQVSFQG